MSSLTSVAQHLSSAADFAGRMQGFAEAFASGLGSGLSFTLSRMVRGLGAASSLYTFPAYFSPSWLGIATLERFPRL